MAVASAIGMAVGDGGSVARAAAATGAVPALAPATAEAASTLAAAAQPGQAGLGQRLLRSAKSALQRVLGPTTEAADGARGIPQAADGATGAWIGDEYLAVVTPEDRRRFSELHEAPVADLLSPGLDVVPTGTIADYAPTTGFGDEALPASDDTMRTLRRLAAWKRLDTTTVATVTDHPAIRQRLLDMPAQFDHGHDLDGRVNSDVVARALRLERRVPDPAERDALLRPLLERPVGLLDPSDRIDVFAHDLVRDVTGAAADHSPRFGRASYEASNQPAAEPELVLGIERLRRDLGVATPAVDIEHVARASRTVSEAVVGQSSWNSWQDTAASTWFAHATVDAAGRLPQAGQLLPAATQAELARLGATLAPGAARQAEAELGARVRATLATGRAGIGADAVPPVVRLRAIEDHAMLAIGVHQRPATTNGGALIAGDLGGIHAAWGPAASGLPEQVARSTHLLPSPASAHTPGATIGEDVRAATAAGAVDLRALQAPALALARAGDPSLDAIGRARMLIASAVLADRAPAGATLEAPTDRELVTALRDVVGSGGTRRDWRAPELVQEGAALLDRRLRARPDGADLAPLVDGLPAQLGTAYRDIATANEPEFAVRSKAAQSLDLLDQMLGMSDSTATI